MLTDECDTPIKKAPTESSPLPTRRPVRCGEHCPRCGEGILDYNGLLDLECPLCAFTEGPGGGCT